MRVHRIPSSRPSIVIAAIATGLLLAACSTNNATGGGTHSAAASGSTVTLSGLAFSPTSLTVKAGTTVTFQNKDTVDHTVTNGKDGTPDANAAFDKSLPAGQSVDITFDKAGTFNVTCKIHSSMNMTVTVQ